MGTTIIGIDCAAQDKNIGIALARFEGGEARIDCVKSGGEVRTTLKQWMKDNSPALLALDAPLGWPGPMAEALGTHAAGQKLGAGAHAMFWRSTDHIVWDLLKRPPLAVGANLIALTSHAALELLEDPRNKKSGLHCGRM